MNLEQSWWSHVKKKAQASMSLISIFHHLNKLINQYKEEVLKTKRMLWKKMFMNKLPVNQIL